MPYTEPLLAPAVEARIREIVRDELRQLGLVVEINGTVQIDHETIGKLTWPTLQVRIDDDLALSLSQVGTPGGNGLAGAAAVGGVG
jgi:hypothetical protein